MKEVRAVFFDVVGTLLHPEPSAATVYAAVARQFGSQLDGQAVGRSFRIAFARQEELDRISGWRTSEDRELERWRTIVQEVLHDVRDQQSCFAMLYDHFADPAHWLCDPGAAVVLAHFRQQGMQLGLASNYDSRLHRVVAGIPQFADVGHVVISSEVGWRKPALEFFAAMSSASKVPLHEILLVGDDLENDYQGALNAGCQTVLYDPRGRAHSHCRTIRNLSELARSIG